MTSKPSPKTIKVFARWRRLPSTEPPQSEFTYTTNLQSTSTPSPLSSISITPPTPTPQPYKTPPAFTSIFHPSDPNATLYTSLIAPLIPRVLHGTNTNIFAYGHSGSGKTHTIIGYDYDDPHELGLSLAAAQALFKEIDLLNATNTSPGNTDKLGLSLSLFELRNKSAFDLLNRGTECFIRQGPDGRVHIRGETEMLDGGKVRVCPIVKRACWTFDSLKEELTRALDRRQVGSSSVHDLSSRTHAVLELEVVCQSLVDARMAVVDRQSELVPVGKRATDVVLEEQSRGVVAVPGGGWTANPDYVVDQGRIDAVAGEKAEFERRVVEAEEVVSTILRTRSSMCLGAKMVFVDLAGAEYHQEKGSQLQTPKQTPQERQEGRQINTDLLALKEVMRAWSKGQARIPFRSSALTMVLREHFLDAGEAESAMIVTLSSAKEQYAATMNSLKYGSLVGVSNG